MNKHLSLVLIATLVSANAVFAAENYNYTNTAPAYQQQQYYYTPQQQQYDYNYNNYNYNYQQQQQQYNYQAQQPQELRPIQPIETPQPQQEFGAENTGYQEQYYTQNQNQNQNQNQAQVQNTNYNATQQPLKGHIITVPAGQSFPAVTTMALSSENLTLGQGVSVALGSDFYYNGSLIAPAGSTVTGQVLDVSRAKHGSMNGKLMIRFTQIVTLYGIQIPISAVIKTNDNSGLLVGGTKMDVAKDYGKDIVVGSAAGATSGLIMSAISGGKLGKGTALGTAVGAGSGLVKSIWDKGNDVVIPANAGIELSLTQAITVNPAIYNSNY